MRIRDLGAKVIYHRHGLWGILKSRDIDECSALRECVEKCADICGLIRSGFEIGFQPLKEAVYIDELTLRGIMEYVKCVDMCMQRRTFMKLVGYKLFLTLEPLLLVAQYGCFDSIEGVKLFIAIAPDVDKRILESVIEELKSDRLG